MSVWRKPGFVLRNPTGFYCSKVFGILTLRDPGSTFMSSQVKVKAKFSYAIYEMHNSQNGCKDI